MVQLRELTRILILLLVLLSQSSADYPRPHPRPPSRSPKHASTPILTATQPPTQRDTLYENPLLLSLFRQAQVYRRAGDARAEGLYRQLLLSRSQEPLLYLHYAQALALNGNYRPSQEALKTYHARRSGSQRASRVAFSGKSQVRPAAGGYRLDYLALNTSADEFLAALEEHKPDILGMSALLATTMPYMKVVIDTLKERGLREKYVVMVGGAPLNEEFGAAIGADAYCRDAAVAAETAKALVNAHRRRPEPPGPSV